MDSFLAGPDAGYGLPGEETPVDAGFGFAPSPSMAPPATPANAESLAAQHAITTGEDSAALAEEIQRLGPYRALDRAYGTHMTEQQKSLHSAANQAAAQGDTGTVTAFLKQMQDNQNALLTDAASHSEKQIATATDAAIQLGAADSHKNFASDEGFLNEADKAGHARGVGNTFEQELAEAEATAVSEHSAKSLLDKFGLWGRDLTYGQVIDTPTMLKTLRDVTGSSDYMPDALVNQAHAMYVGASPEVRAAMRARIDQMSPELRAHTYALLREGMSRGESAFEVGNSLMAATVIFDAANAVRATGKAAVSLSRTAGKDVAGRVVGKDILEGSKLSDLSATEQVTAAMSAGKHPGFVDPASLSGASSTVQDAVIKQGQDAWAAVVERLRAGGRTTDEVAQAQNEIKAAFDPAVRKDVHSVEFTDAGDAGQGVVANWKRPDGTLFASAEEAQAYAKAHGMQGVEVVPERGVVTKAFEEQAFEPDARQVVKPRLKGPVADYRTVEMPAVQQGNNANQLPGFFKGMAAGISDSFYEGVFKALQDGKTKFAGVKEPLLAQAKADFDKGLIKSPADLRAFSEKGSAKSAAADAVPTLPKELQGAKPRYKTKDVRFESDLDKAAYIIAQSTPSKADAAYLKFVMDHTGYDEAAARQYGERIKGRVSFADLAGHSSISPSSEALGKGSIKPDMFTFSKEEADILSSRVGEHLSMVKQGMKTAADSTELGLYRQQETALKEVQKLVKAGKWREVEEKAAELGLLDDLDFTKLDEGFKDVGVLRAEIERSFEGGKNVTFSHSIDQETRGLYQDLADALGLKGERLHVGTAEEIGALAPGWDSVKHAAGGFYMSPKNTGGSFHAIALNKARDVGPKQALQTKLHELGHMYHEAVLMRDPKNLRMLQAEFAKFVDSTPSIAERFAKFRQSGTIKFGDDGELLLPHNFDSKMYQKWFSQFDEWYAEQFGKAMLTVEKPRTVVQQYFADLVQGIRDLYQRIAARLGYSTERANSLVEAQLRQHMASLEKDQSIAKMFDNMLSETPEPKLNLTAPEETGTDGFVLRQRMTVPYSYSSVGRYAESDIHSMPWIAVDPKHAASQFAVEERVIGIHAEDKTRRALGDLVTKAFSPLSGEQKQRVFNVLTEGDAYSNLNGAVGREFNGTELMGMGLSESEQLAYYAARQARNITHTLRDSEMVRDLVASGHKNVTFSVVENEVGRQISQPGRFVDASTVVGKTVYSAVEGTAKRITADFELGLNEQVIRLHAPVEINGRQYQHILGDARTVRQSDITSVLPYRPGEFSRIYTDEYFVLAKGAHEVDGVSSATESVIRTAKSQKEAAKYVSDMNAAVELMRLARAGEHAPRNLEGQVAQLIGAHTDAAEFISQFDAGMYDGIKFDHKFTRSKEEYLNLFTGQSLTERPFTGVRGARIYSVDRNRQNTLDVMRSLEAEITNVSRVANIGEWRETQIRRWMNTFGDTIADRTGNDVNDFYRLAAGGPLKLARKGQRELFAERTHNYIMRQLGVPTAEEKMYKNWSREVSEKWFNSADGGGKVSSIGAAIRQMAPLNFLRSVNFNLALGMFNPAQLLVQANGMAQAVILHPLHGLRAAKTYPLLRLALMSDNPAVWKHVGAFNSLTELGLSSADEFARLVKSVRKSGIIDNLNSTALHNTEEGKLGVVTGLGGKVLAAGRIPFNRGEEASRLISFDVARREWAAKHPGVAWDSDAALKDIVVRMDDLTQNMTKANQAAWQKGALSIPMQFLQYNVKLASNVLTSAATGVQRAMGKDVAYRGFTAAESAKIMAGHLVVYGTAGYGATQFMDEILGPSLTNSMTPEQKAYVSQGLISGVIASMTADEKGEGGTQIAVGSRLGSFDYYVNMADKLFSKDTSLWDAIAGPSKQTGARLGAAADIVKLWRAGALETPEAVLEGLGKIATEEISTLRNATRAYLYYQNNGVMSNGKGTPIAQLNNQEILGQALGFQPSQAVDVYSLIQEKTARSDALNQVAELVYKLQREQIMAAQRKDYKTVEDKQKAIGFLMPKNAGDFAQVERRIKDHLYPGDTEFQHLMGQYLLEGFHPGTSNPFVVTSKPGSYVEPTPGSTGEKAKNGY